MQNESTTSSSSAAAPAAARWRARWRHAGAHPRHRAGRHRSRRRPENWDPDGGLEGAALPRRKSAGSTIGRARVPPYTHYCVGGNTKFWGSVLYRLRREDFEGVGARRRRVAGLADRYDDLAPYYDRAERLYHVHGQAGLDPTEIRRADRSRIRRCLTPPGWQRIVERLRAQGLHPSPLPLGLIRPGEEGGCVLCDTCNSFPCKIGAKSDAETCWLRPARRDARERDAVDQRAGDAGCVTDASGTRVEAVEVERDGRERSRSKRRLFVVSCGAVNSAALLLRSASDAHPHGLANSSGLVGRRYMAHLATMMQGFGPLRRNATAFRRRWRSTTST